MRPVLSEPARKWLTAAEDGLMRGAINLQDLPLEVSALYHLGRLEGMRYAAEQAREYEHKLDLLYLQAFNPQDRAKELQRRLDAHFRAENERFFTEVHTPAQNHERRAA